MGSFGHNHARVYHELQKAGHPVELVAIVDSDRARAEAVSAQFAARPFQSSEELVAAHRSGELELHAASIAVPTVHHLAAARSMMEAGVDVLIEKPLAASMEDADELIRIRSLTGRIAQTGHLERYNPAVQATIPLLNKPMFFECHRLSIFTPRSLDVDVVLDLMIHDLDIVLSFADSPVKEVRAVGLPILSSKVDIANVRVEFDSGCVANFTASRVSTERIRKLRFFQPHEYLSIDYARQDVIRIGVEPSAFALGLAGPGSTKSPLAAVPVPSLPATMPALAPSSPGGGMPGIRLSKPEVIAGEPLLAEILSFLASVSARTQPVVTLEDGRRALSLALDITKAMAEHHHRANIDAVTSQ